MALSKHEEIERKLAADDVDRLSFCQFVWSRAPAVERFLHVAGPDYYHKNADRVVRHRVGKLNDRHELTIKLRTSESSTLSRREINLGFDRDTAPFDVQAFLDTAGFKRAMTIVKDADIFWVRPSDKITLTVVIYDAWRQEEERVTPTNGTPYTRAVRVGQRRFIEVEAEAGSEVTVETAKRHVADWVKALREQFGLGEPLNESLWEIYSGERYDVV